MYKKAVVSTPTKTIIFLKGLLISLLTVFGFILLFSAILLLLNLPKTSASPLSSVAFGVGAFLGSLYSSKKIGQKGYMCGIIIATLLMLINAIVGLILNGSAFSAIFFIRMLITYITAIFGGIIGINSNVSKSLVK